MDKGRKKIDLKPKTMEEKKMREAFERWYHSREFVPHGVMISNLCYLGFKQGAEYMRQQIKSACEFYLKYKDEPELLFEEKREYRVILAHLFGDDKDTSRYNDWLFKEVFRCVLEEENE